MTSHDFQWKYVFVVSGSVKKSRKGLSPVANAHLQGVSVFDGRFMYFLCSLGGWAFCSFRTFRLGLVQGWESKCWGVLGIPLLENTKVTKFPFHVFDRYEINILDFEDLLRGSSSSVGARLRNWKTSNFQNCKLRHFKTSIFQKKSELEDRYTDLPILS